MHTSKKILLIQKFFRKNINIDQNLFENNFLDSLKVIDLINFLEKKTKKKNLTNKSKSEVFFYHKRYC